MPPFVSASGIVLHEGRILVVFYPIRREPVLPGGHLRWRERPVDAVQRETREETGLIVETGSLVGVFAGEELTGEPGIVRVVYEAIAVSGRLRSSAEGEASWMELEQFVGLGVRDSRIVSAWLSGG